MDVWKAVQDFLNEYYNSFGKLDIETKTTADILPKILKKSSENLKFREKLINSPVKVFAQEGFKLPKGFNLKLVEETENTIFLPLFPFVGESYQKENHTKLTKLDDVIQRALTDMDFRKEFINTPKKLLIDEGFNIDSQKNIVILENTDDLFYVVLPAIENTISKDTESFKFTIDNNILFLYGRLDANSVDEIRNTLLDWQGDLKLNLENLNYISSVGLGLLLTTLKKLKQSSNEMKLINLQPAVKNVFALAGFDKIFDL